jgi:GTP-binding protein EngB required for normal cell division
MNPLLIVGGVAVAVVGASVAGGMIIGVGGSAYFVNQYKKRLTAEQQKELLKIKKEIELVDQEYLIEENLRRKIFQKLLELPIGEPSEFKDVIFLGKNSVGKSALINFLCGKPICKVGKSLTTEEKKDYVMETTDKKLENVKKIKFWDYPGFNENSTNSYRDEWLVSFLKGKPCIGVVCESTLFDIKNIIELLTFLKIDFFIVVSKCDRFFKEDEEEEGEETFEEFKNKIIKELQTLKIGTSKGPFFISTRKKYVNEKELMVGKLKELIFE